MHVMFLFAKIAAFVHLKLNNISEGCENLDLSCLHCCVTVFLLDDAYP